MSSDEARKHRLNSESVLDLLDELARWRVAADGRTPDDIARALALDSLVVAAIWHNTSDAGLALMCPVCRDADGYRLELWEGDEGDHTLADLKTIASAHIAEAHAVAPGGGTPT